MKRISICLIWAISFFLSGSISAQDKTYSVCPGGIILIKASDGGLGYKWDPSPSLTNVNIQQPYAYPSSTTIYTVRYKTKDGTNLVLNGDFEFGNVGFSSEYINSPPGTVPRFDQGNYDIASNPQVYNGGFSACSDHTGVVGGKMLVADGASGNYGVPPGAQIWTQTISVQPNTDYAFSSWLTNISTGNPSSLKFSINGVEIGLPLLSQSGTCNWQEFYVMWNSGTSTTAIISIAEGTGSGGGNDFAIDDISFSEVKDIVETVEVKVGPPTVTPVVSGDNSLCLASSVTLNTSIGGGTWKSSNTAVATIDATGKITPKILGETDITYTIGGQCGSKTSVPFKVTVTNGATQPTITGNNSLCLGTTVNLTGSVGGGTWTSSNTAVATVDANGEITGLSAGATNITYAISTSCGSATSLPFAVTVTTGATKPTVTGDNSLCLTGTLSLTGSATGGTWASSNTAVATIDATGKITPVTVGTTNITYAITSSCGNTTSLPFTVTVNAGATTPTITGSNSLCLASTITLTGSAMGGTWASGNTAVATIDATGKITPVSAGTTDITYAITGPCGNATSLPFTVTVNAVPPTPTISGNNSLCLGDALSLTGSVAGGTWASTNTAIATIDAAGKITPISAGITDITYTISSPCGNPVSLPFTVTVNAKPQLGQITGTAELTLGQVATLTIDLPGGTWKSADETVAEIATDGTVKGIKNGKTEITYSLNTLCGLVVSVPFQITVLGEDLYIPNAFTPNDDGNNDDFRVFGSAIDKIDLSIFNQWGELVYNTTDKSRGWTGTYKGEKAPTGVYIFTAKIKLTNGEEMIKKGAVNLIR